MKFYKKIKFENLKSSDKLIKLLKKYKVVLVKSWIVDSSLQMSVENYLTGIGTILDDSDEDLSTGEKKNNKFIDISFDPSFTNLYRTSSNFQPLHTDFSYVDVENNVQFLMCKSAASHGGATTFIDSKDLIKLMIIDKKEKLIEDLKSIDVGFKKCDDRQKKTKIIKQIGNDFRLNYNYQPFLRFGNEESVITLVNEFKNYLDMKIEKSGLLKEVLLEKNDVVFFHDSLVFHGRNSYFANKKGERTLIKGTLII